MTGLIIGILQVWAAIWIFRHILRAIENHDINQQKNRWMEEARLEAEKVKAIASKPELGELDQLLLQDAMNRETRAKAALIAVLQSQGCSERQIEDVLKTVDDQRHSL
jgi:hypothetical protein